MLKVKKDIIKLFKDNPYVITLYLNEYNKLLLIYNYAMVDTTRLQRDIIPILLKENYKDIIASLKEIPYQDIVKSVLNSSLIIYDQKDKSYYALDLNNVPTRSVSESSVDITISGPKDSLIESIDKNIALIQKRLKTEELIIKDYTLGELTKTKVALLYLNKSKSINIASKIDEKLSSSKIESLTNIGQIESILSSKKSLVPLYTYTARGDFICESLISNKVILIIDGIPLALVAPSTFFFFLEFHDSLSENFFVIFFDRALFIIALLLALLLSPFVLAVINYYPELLSIDLISTTINSRKGISFSFTSETIIAEIFLQLFRIAGTRLPKGLDSSLLVVGSFLIGSVIIDAGILSQEALFIASTSVITSYVISNNSSFNTSINIFRYFLLFLTIRFGLVGMSVGILILLIYLASNYSIDTPYLFPYSPFNFKEFKNTFIPSNVAKKKGNKKNEKT
jgi:hypothetical protein